MVDLSIIIPSFNTKKLTLECINSIDKHTKGIEYEIIVVDNASQDGSLEVLRKLQSPQVVLIENRINAGYAKANNQGIRKAKAPIILLLNSDTIIEGSILPEIIKSFEKMPKAGILGCELRNADGSTQASGGYFPTLTKIALWMFFLDDIPLLRNFIKPYHHVPPRKKHEQDWVTGAFFLIKKDLVDNIGYLDEDYFAYVEELDYCYRAKLSGWEVWYDPTWHIIHYGGASTTSSYPLLSEFRGLKLFYKKHIPKYEYGILRLLLKLGALLRIPLLGILRGGETAKIYAKAFREA